MLNNLSFIEMAMVGCYCSIKFCTSTTSGYRKKVEGFVFVRRQKMNYQRCLLEIQRP